ncbi:HEPN/Toprim-associated domain-containing protein [Paracoccus sp. 228]|uniref:HEPN/Toprim-associated domain-containing protein n=1 Tax=Paracoccus sp. 228 TaxID=1192054 RepID=UPI000B042993|nr:HEPN/Toprim-associated domain-containing protein [Paracoccus sp. 228]
MGTYSDFRIGNFHLESGGNFNTTTHQSIYLPSDSVTLEREYEPRQVEGFRATLRSILPRLELLGSTLPAIEQQFNNPFVTYDEPHDIPFREALELIRNTDLSLLVEYDGRDHAGLLPGEYQKRLEDPLHGRYGRSPGWDVSTLLDRLTPYDILRVLAERPENLDLIVQWDFMDVVDSGYFERKDFSVGARGRGFLLVTEGTSDTKLIQHAFAILRPEIADFFQFVDMEDNYPFGGHGNLMNFMRGLRSIGKADGVLAIFDNDTVGVASLAHLKKLSGINAIKLPDLEEFKEFPTIGPSGEHLADINGRAAAIECYLKLLPDCRIRWTNYDQRAGTYQGSIDQTSGEKSAQQDEFLRTTRSDDYPFDKMEKVLDLIVEACINLSVQRQE